MSLTSAIIRASLVSRSGLALVLAAAAACSRESPESTLREFNSLRQEFVDLYLQQNPTLATSLGEHRYDGLLADLSARGVEAGAQRYEDLLVRLQAIDPAALAAADRLEHALLEGRLRAELLERREIRTQARNPMVYGLEVSFGLLELVVRPFAPAAERMRSAAGRLRAVPALLEAARANLQRPPEVFTRTGLEIARAGAEFVAHDYSEAFGPVSDLDLRADFESARAEAASALREFVAWMETALLPRSDGEFALGEDRLMRKLQYEELLDVPLARVLALGEEELERQRAELVRLAGEVLPGATPREAVAALARQHPRADEVVPEAERLLQEALAFLRAHAVVTLPDGPPPEVDPTPPFYRFTFASMHPAGPFEKNATDSYYYLTLPEPDWPPGRVEQHLAEFNRWLLPIVTLHEVYPGHYLQALALRQPGPGLRRVIPVASYVEGWAHYCEQMMLEEGYGGGDARLRIMQLKDSLLRLCRLVAAVRLHTSRMTLDQATRLFVEKAFMEPLPARQEAERGAYDSTYLVYALGKMQMLKLRDDVRAAEGTRFSLRDFHDRVLAEGVLPLPLLRRALLPNDARTSL